MPSKKKTPKKALWLRFLFFITKPLRSYIQYRFKVSVMKDVALEEARLRLRKPHWSERLVKKRARQRYVGELKKIGVV